MSSTRVNHRIRAIARSAVLLSLAGLAAAPARAACPGLCSNPSFTVDTDGDHVVDAVECHWCASWAGTALDMDPTDSDSDDDGKLDHVDAYPGDPIDSDELDFAASCGDPTTAFQDLRDAEFNEEQRLVTWIQDFDPNPFADALLWVAPVQSDGSFGLAKQVDSRVLSIGENTKNGPEWLFDQAKGGVILYGKQPSTGPKSVYYAYNNGTKWVVKSLVTDGTTPLGTMVWNDPTPGVMFARKISGTWTHMFCPFNGCNGAYPKAGPPISNDPPDPMRLAEGQDPGEWYLVGVDYQASVYRRLVRWAPGSDTTTLLSADEAPDKRSGWMWNAYGKDLVITMDVIYSGTQAGPGIIRIFNATDGVWWQTIPVGPLTHRYVESPEPFVFDGTSYVVFAASTSNASAGPTQAILAEVDSDGVAGGGVNPDMLVRRVDAGGAWDSGQKWKDPEGFAYDNNASWVYTVVNNTDTRRCITGL